MPSPRNTRDEDPDLARVVKKLRASGLKVAQVEQARQLARASRREVAAQAFVSGISWRRIAEYAGYGSAQAAQEDVTSKSLMNRQSSD
jgi:hypothetical protein